MVLFSLNVLACSDTCSKIPQIRWFTKNRNLFLVVLEAWKSKIKITVISCLVRVCFLVYGQPSFCYVLRWQKGRESFPGSLLGGLMPFKRALSSRFNHFRSPHLQLAIKIQHINLGKHKHLIYCTGENSGWRIEN